MSLSSSRRTQRGVTMVEFALMAPVFFIFILGLVDFSRIIQANTAVAEAARQAARQGAANADAAPDPYSASPQTGRCSGTQFTIQASGDGCLTDSRMAETANAVMSAGNLTSSLTPHSATPADTCKTNYSPPAAGTGVICFMPKEGGVGGPAPVACPSSGAAGLSLEAYRQTEWANPLSRGCYVVQVTVIYTYQPFTGLLQGLIGNRIVLTSTTSTIAEY